MACGDVLSLEDLQTAKKHQIFEAEVITGKAGGAPAGASIDFATNQVTGQIQKTLPAVLRDAGFQPAAFDFTSGGVLALNDRGRVVFDPVSLGWFSWSGSLPHTVPAGTNPLLDPLWIPQTDPNLSSSLGATLVGTADGGTVQQYIGSQSYDTVASMVADSSLQAGRKVRWAGYYAQSDGGSNWGVVKSGAHVPDGGSIFSITASLYVEANLKGKTLNVLKFGAKTDGSDSFAYIQSAINYAENNGIGVLRFSSGTYTITDTLVVDFAGFGHGLDLIGEGVNETVIRQTGAGKDCLKYSATTLVEDSAIKGLTLSCSSVSGDVINIGFGLVRCTISPRLIQDNPSRSLIVGNFTGGKLGAFDTVFEKAVWKLAPNSTAYGVDITVDGTIFNENTFRNLVVYNATAKHFFSIKTAGAGAVWLVNNHFHNINFEVCKGGGIEFQSAKTWSFRNISFWDAGGAYTNHLIHSKDGTSLDSIACLFENISRNGDSLAGGISDIHIDATNGASNTYINCTTSADTTPRYDLNNSTCQIIGFMNGVINGVNAAVVALGDVTANNLNVSSNGKIFSPATGIVKTQVLPNSGTHQLSLKNAGGVELTVATDETGVYPYDDNARSMGKGVNRWSVIFAGTGSINTSDGREKTTPIAITDAVLDAWGDVQLIAYKWLDSIQLKGEDTARWHFGVIAQQVRDAFAAHGLDGTDYGLLCYDEWGSREAVLSDDGVVVVPAIVAGSRWGIRPDQCLFVEAAYQRRRSDRIEARLQAAGI